MKFFNIRFFTAKLLFALILFLVSAPTAFGQESDLLTGTGFVISLPIVGDVQNGDIIASGDEGYKLTSYAYQPSIYGVITSSPAVFLESGDLNPENTYPVLTTGKAYVRVSTINGPIVKNDFLTSSEISGAGSKSTANGFVLGIALEDYNEENPQEIGTILAYVNPHFNATFIATRANLLQNIRNIADSPFLSPLTTLRYLLAGLVAIASFILGFVHFGRIVKTGIEAIGRNPLASVSIQLGVLMNVVLTIGIVLAGVGVSYLILAL